MSFINPIEILELQNYDISEIDNIIIKKAKRKAIAEIELSDEGYLNYKGYKIIKSDVERVINELEDKEKIEFYSFIANNSELNFFLTTGNESIFLSFKQESIYKLPNFINFISPFFAINYDKALYKSFKTNNEVLLQRIISVKPLVKDSDLEICYKSISNSIKKNITEIDQLTSDIKNEESIYDEFDIQDVYDIVLEKLNVKIINQLPIYFQSIRNKSANSIRNLSVNIFNTFDDSNLALEIINYALEFKIDGLTKQNLNNDYEQIYKINNEREELEINAPILEKYASFLIELREKLNFVERRKLTPEFIESWVNSNILVSEINELNIVFDEIRSQIALSLRAMSTAIWNNFNDVKISLRLINKAISIQNIPQETMKLLIESRYQLNEICKKLNSDLLKQKPAFSKNNLNELKTKQDSNSYGGLIAVLMIGLFVFSFYYFDNNKTKNISESTNNKTSNNSSESITTDNPSKSTNKIQDTKFIGNQLRNGDSPLDNCFGKGKFGGPSYITFYNTNESDALVCLVNTNTGKTIRNEYIRKGMDYKMKSVPAGTYYLKYVSGNDWNPNIINFCGSKGNFQSNVHYSKSDSPSDYITVIIKGGKFSYHEITLYSVYNGNMSQESIDESEFFK